MAITTDLNNIKVLEQGLTANKVSRFAYTQTAYDNNMVAGVPDYDPDRAMNVPQGTASVMQVNQTVIDKGWRAQASALTRMLMNHFLGRISYNLNKAHDNLLSLVTSLVSSLGTAGGIATLGANGLLDSSQYPVKVNDISPDASAQIVLKADDIDTHLVKAPDLTNLGRVWTYSNNTNGNFLSVYYANGIWVAGGYVNDGLWWSYDGKTWTQSNVTNYGFYCVYYADGIWVAGCAQDDGLWWSNDGKTWTRSNLRNGAFFCVYHADGIWVAGSDSLLHTGLWWSNDGKTWTQSNVTDATCPCVYYTNGIWVAGSGSSGLWWSSDGKTWTQSNKTDGYFKCIYYSNGIWVAGSGSSGSGLWWSSDGKTWTQSNKTDNNFYSVYYADGIWVAGSGSGTGLWWSYDGKTWARSNRTNFSFWCVYYADEIWVAGGQANYGLYYSMSSGMTQDVEQILRYLIAKVS